MKTQTSPVSQASTAHPKVCYVCGATDDIRVAYWYWPEDLPPSAGKVAKWICNDGRRCCRNIDRKWEAVHPAKAVSE